MLAVNSSVTNVAPAPSPHASPLHKPAQAPRTRLTPRLSTITTRTKSRRTLVLESEEEDSAPAASEWESVEVNVQPEPAATASPIVLPATGPVGVHLALRACRSVQEPSAVRLHSKLASAFPRLAVYGSADEASMLSHTISPMVNALFGEPMRSSTIVCQGATGSESSSMFGDSFTPRHTALQAAEMEGADKENPAASESAPLSQPRKGVLAHALKEIFARMDSSTSSSDCSFVLSLSLMDILPSDSLVDCLATPSSHGANTAAPKLLESKSGALHVSGLTRKLIRPSPHAFALCMRTLGADLQAMASASASGAGAGAAQGHHRVVTITVERCNKRTGQVGSAHLQLIDLASPAVVSGASHRNQSLAALDTLLLQLSKSTPASSPSASAAPLPHVSFRDSKLTRLLKSCFAASRTQSHCAFLLSTDAPCAEATMAFAAKVAAVNTWAEGSSAVAVAGEADTKAIMHEEMAEREQNRRVAGGMVVLRPTSTLAVASAGPARSPSASPTRGALLSGAHAQPLRVTGQSIRRKLFESGTSGRATQSQAHREGRATRRQVNFAEAPSIAPATALVQPAQLLDASSAPSALQAPTSTSKRRWRFAPRSAVPAATPAVTELPSDLALALGIKTQPQDPAVAAEAYAEARKRQSLVLQGSADLAAELAHLRVQCASLTEQLAAAQAAAAVAAISQFTPVQEQQKREAASVADNPECTTLRKRLSMVEQQIADVSLIAAVEEGETEAEAESLLAADPCDSFISLGAFTGPPSPSLSDASLPLLRTGSGGGSASDAIMQSSLAMLAAHGVNWSEVSMYDAVEETRESSNSEGEGEEGEAEQEQEQEEEVGEEECDFPPSPLRRSRSLPPSPRSDTPASRRSSLPASSLACSARVRQLIRRSMEVHSYALHAPRLHMLGGAGAAAATAADTPIALTPVQACTLRLQRVRPASAELLLPAAVKLDEPTPVGPAAPVAVGAAPTALTRVAADPLEAEALALRRGAERRKANAQRMVAAAAQEDILSRFLWSCNIL